MCRLKLILTLYLISFLASCNLDKKDLGIATNYLPAQDLLRKGVVNKYYDHVYKKGARDTSTTVYYRLYQLKEDKLWLSNYEHANKKLNERSYSIDNDKFILEQSRIFTTLGDTVNYSISDSISADWINPNATVRTTGVHSWGVSKSEYNQVDIKDSIVLDLPAKCFSFTNLYTDETEKDTLPYIYKGKTIFVKGLGLYCLTNISLDNGTKYWCELVDQMLLDEFLETGKDEITAVAYIDNNDILDKDTSVELCNTNNNKIYQYYNGQQTLHFENGKRGQWDIIRKNLDSEKIYNESGYLTFRFIVNCQGEASKYVTEQADLDYRPKQFNQKTIDHFYEITKKMDAWIPTLINGQPVDAYFYITYKLEQGNLIEILP